MLRAAARIIVSLWLLGGATPAALAMKLEAREAPGALEITLKASEAPGAAAGETIKLYSASKALVIGIDHYSAGWPKLSGAVEDAKAVAAALKLQGFEVTLVSDPAQEELDRAFRDFFIKGGADPDARLFVWFAGHGHTIKNGGGDDEGYIVPRDAPSPQVSDLEFRDKAIPLRRFGEYMREARAKHVLAVFDSCFGGTVFNVARALPPPAITRATALPVRQFISSGDADQEVSDDGTFRKLFIDALQGAEPSADMNKDGYLTGTGLGQFLYTKMTNLTGQRQTPRYGKLNARGYDRGDFVFQLREAKAALAPLPKAAEGPQAPVSEAAREWGKIENSAGIAELEAYRKQFGAANPYYDMRAGQRIAALKEKLAEPGVGSPGWWPFGAGQKQEPAKPGVQQTAAVAPPPPPPAEPACDGLLVSVATGKKPCVKPGSGAFFKDCPDCPEMVPVPAGTFTMGSPKDEDGRYDDEGPQHKVTIEKPFAVGRTHVTRGQFAKFAKTTGYKTDGGCWTLSGGSWNEDKNASWRSPGFNQDDDHPVVCLKWEDASAYAAWLAKTTGQPYRLLTEAEAEYAARGLTKAGAYPRYFFGNDETDLCTYANGLDATAKASGETPANWTYSSCKDGHVFTAPVMSFKPNAFGLYDVHGNAWTLTQDCWNAKYVGAPDDGTAWTTGNCSQRVVRGGSWADFPWLLRAAARNRYYFRNGLVGLRLARTLRP